MPTGRFQNGLCQKPNPGESVQSFPCGTYSITFMGVRRFRYASLHGKRMRSHFLPLLAAILVAACHPSPKPAIREVEKVSTFEGSGVLRKVDAERRKAVIAHDVIAGYMEAMTMEFDVAEAGPVAALQPGDVIAFRLSVTEARSWIDQVRKTGHVDVASPAEPAAGSLPAGAPLPDCALVNQRGAAFRLSDFKGRALAFTFIFTRCPLPDFCPRMNRNLAEVQRELSADLGFTFGDACVSLDGYPIPIPPPSGAMQIAAYEAINANVLWRTRK